jgi:DNA-binding transcriptional ArsR family regulator
LDEPEVNWKILVLSPIYLIIWLNSFKYSDIFNHMVELAVASLDSVFHALSDATRRAILRDVSREAKTVGEIAEPYSMSLAAVSKHLQVLERAELVRREKKGNYRMVRLNADTLRAAQEWLAYYETFWTGQLDALQNYLETAETPGEDLQNGNWNGNSGDGSEEG